MSALTSTIAFRPITDDDQEFLCALYASTREDELAHVPWTAEQKEAFLRQQFGAQRDWWQAQYADAATFDVVVVDGEPAGRLYVHRSSRELRIVDVSLLPEFRRNGIGTRLLQSVFDEADGVGKITSIHVEIYNPARRLYERMGFLLAQDKGVYLLMERAPQVNTAS